jgi:hypothetical protein
MWMLGGMRSGRGFIWGTWSEWAGESRVGGVRFGDMGVRAWIS